METDLSAGMVRQWYRIRLLQDAEIIADQLTRIIPAIHLRAD
jgi:hypothetical protein